MMVIVSFHFGLVVDFCTEVLPLEPAKVIAMNELGKSVSSVSVST